MLAIGKHFSNTDKLEDDCSAAQMISLNNFWFVFQRKLKKIRLCGGLNFHV